jgi:hypothetical protein
MAMQKWEKVYNLLQQKSEKLGFDPPEQIGSANSQVFEYSWRGVPVLIIGFRDLGRKPGYSAPNHLWAEGLDLVLNRYKELARSGRTPLPQAAAIVIDNIGDAYIVVMITELLELYRTKGLPTAPDGSRRFTFVVRREPTGYFLKMPYGLSDVPLTSVNKIESLLLLLKGSKPVD